MALQFKALIPKYHLPIQNPFFPGPTFYTITDDTRHRTRGKGCVVLEDHWIIAWRDANTHWHDDLDSSIRCADSRNGGLSLYNEREIYNEGACDATDMRMWMMDGGRIGIMSERWPGGVSLDYPVFIYSDDDGVTWNSQILNNPALGHVQGNISYDWIRFPASVGGADVGGWIGFISQSRLPAPVKDLHAVYTVDNGTTWNMLQVIGPAVMAPYEAVDEPIIQRLGNEDKWILMFRCEMTGIAPIITPVFRSTDLFNWAGPFPSGQSQRRNNSRIQYKDGYITWISFTRPYQTEAANWRGVPVDGEYFQGLVSQTVGASELWEDPGCWPGWQEFVRLAHPHGDLELFQVPSGVEYGLLGIQEGPFQPGVATKTYSQLGIMCSSDLGASRPSNKITGGTFGDTANRALGWNLTPKQGAAFNIVNAAASPFSGAINGNPTSTSVVYDGETNGNCLRNLQSGAGFWGRFILHNTTRSNSRLITEFNVATRTITTEASTDDWANNDVITLQSTTCTQAGYMDVDLSNELSVREVVAYFQFEGLDISAGDTAARRAILHPFEAYAGGKRVMCAFARASEFSFIQAFVPINDQKVCVFFQNNTDATIQLAVLGTLDGNLPVL